MRRIVKTAENRILDRVLKKYPMPIANPARWMLDGVHRGDDLRHFQNGILDTYEAIVHFLALIQLREYLEKEVSNAEFNKELQDLLLSGKNLCLGHWAWMVRELTGILLALGEPMILEGLGRLMKQNSWIEEAKPLDNLVKQRNKYKGHPTEFLKNRDLKQLVEQNRPVILDLLSNLAFLCELDLIGVVGWQSPGSDIIRDAFIFRGKDPDMHYHPHFGQRVPVPVEPGEREGLLLLWAREREICLKLGPMALFFQDLQLDLQDAYFLTSLNIRSRKIRNAVYRSYSVGIPAITKPQVDEGPSWLKAITSWLNERFNLDEEQRLIAEKSSIDPRINQILAAKQVGFVGRKTLFTRVKKELLSGHRIAHLKGPKGQGKSAFAARFVQQMKDKNHPVLYYFFSLTEGTTSVEAALFHLITQAFDLGLADAPPDSDCSVEELISILHDVLTNSSGKSGQSGEGGKLEKRNLEKENSKVSLLVFDGLDEADNKASALQSLWSGLDQVPPGEYAAVLLVGREDSPVTSASQVEIEGLTCEDIQQVLLSRGINVTERFAEQLCCRIAGNPLLLMRIIEILPDNPEENDLPEEKLDWQKSEVERLMGEAVLQGLETPFRKIMTLFYVAVEPLGPSSIRNIIQIPEGRFRQILRIISPILSGRTRLGYYHHSIREAVGGLLREEHGQEIIEMHKELADMCRRNSDDSYARHLIHHLINSNSFAAAVNQMKHENMVKKLKAGIALEDLLADVRRIISAINHNEPAQLPALCTVLKDLVKTMTWYHRQKDPMEMADRLDVNSILKYAELFEEEIRRRLLISACLCAHSRRTGKQTSQEFEHLTEILKLEFETMKFGRITEDYRKLLQTLSEKRNVKISRDTHLKQLPRIARLAVMIEDLKTAVNAIKRFSAARKKDGNVTNAGLEKQILLALAFLGPKDRQQFNGYPLLFDDDVESRILFNIIKDEIPAARKLFEQLPRAEKPGRMRMHTLLALLLRKEDTVEYYLHELRSGYENEYIKTLCLLAAHQKVNGQYVNQLAKFLMAASERQFVRIVNELANLDQHQLAARMAAHGVSDEMDYSANKFLRWREEVVEMLSPMDPGRAEQLISLLDDNPSQQAALWAILAANVEKGNKSRQDIGRYLKKARSLCGKHETDTRDWLRVREFIAFANNGCQADLDAFFEAAKSIHKGRINLHFPRLLALRFAKSGRIKEAWKVMNQFGEHALRMEQNKNIVKYIMTSMSFWIAFYAAFAQNKDVTVIHKKARDFVSANSTGEFTARLSGRLAYVKRLNGDDIGAAQAFAAAVHQARKINRGDGTLDIHAVASALHWIALDEYRSGLKVEAEAHIREAWDLYSKGKPEGSVTAEILGRMAQIGLADEAILLVNNIRRERRREKAFGYIARGLVARSCEDDTISGTERNKVFRLVNNVLHTIRSYSGRLKYTNSLLKSMLPRSSYYIDSDPIPEGHAALLDFLIGDVQRDTEDGSRGLLAANLNSMIITKKIIRVWIRTLNKPESTGILEEVMRVTVGDAQ